MLALFMGLIITSGVVSEPNWDVRGVEPDVSVKAAEALVTAQKLAESKLQHTVR
jgi:hypothetical protein